MTPYSRKPWSSQKKTVQPEDALFEDTAFKSGLKFSNLNQDVEL